MEHTKLTKYAVLRQKDDEAIGFALLSVEDRRHFDAMANDGAIRLGAMPHDWYELNKDNQGEHEDTIVYLW